MRVQPDIFRVSNIDGDECKAYSKRAGHGWVHLWQIKDPRVCSWDPLPAQAGIEKLNSMAQHNVSLSKFVEYLDKDEDGISWKCTKCGRIGSSQDVAHNVTIRLLLGR